jgi:hypothetical protein
MKIGIAISLGSSCVPLDIDIDARLLRGKQGKERADIIIQHVVKTVILEKVSIEIGPVVKATRNFYDSEFALDRASFGDASWHAEDVKTTLEERGYSTSKKNIELVIDNLSHITESMVEAGWEHIGTVIEDNANRLVKARNKRLTGFTQSHR